MNHHNFINFYISLKKISRLCVKCKHHVYRHSFIPKFFTCRYRKVLLFKKYYYVSQNTSIYRCSSYFILFLQLTKTNPFCTIYPKYIFQNNQIQINLFHHLKDCLINVLLLLVQQRWSKRSIWCLISPTKHR